jgi:hypothetical protein
MSDNTFQEQLITYLGGTTGPTFGPGMTGSNIKSTSSNEFVVGWQGPDAPTTANAGTSCGIELKSLPNSGASLIDFHSTPGYFNNTYDFRMQCSGGATGTPGIGQMICLGSVMDIRCAVNIGDGAPLFRMDFGKVGPFPEAINPTLPITFVAGLFSTNPKVFLTAESNVTTVSAVNPAPFIESLSPTTGTIQLIGDYTGLPGEMFCSWLAIGL